MNQTKTQNLSQTANLTVKSELLHAPGKLSLASKKFHLIGIGGVGMSGLARLLLKNDAFVSGSDMARSALTDELITLGSQIEIGHKEENLNDDTEAVVISAAVREDNPELLTARRKGVRIYKYAQLLGELMAAYEGIAIAGTHGKSTTSSWLLHCMILAGLEPNFIIGAKPNQLDGSSGTGDGEYFIAEACEYDRSFLNLKPKIACILNIEPDHLDYYKNEAEIVEAFRDFTGRLKPNGTLIVNAADKNAMSVSETVRNSVKVITFGLDDSCNIYADKLELIDGLYECSIYKDRIFFGRCRISLPGRHNVLNASAVTAIASLIGMEPEQILSSLSSFTGIDRRLMFKYSNNDITVLDDYAHHPTEIKASLQAVREMYQPKRIWCVFQPHQYSRTRFFLDDFAQSFKLADITIVPEIYFVRDSQEAKREINAQVLVDKIQENGSEALFIESFTGICEHLKKNTRPGDLVITMGAGDIWKVADEYIQWLRRNS